MQEMTQEQMEEMMERQGQSQSKGGKELEISLEQQKGSSPQDSNDQYAPEDLPYLHSTACPCQVAHGVILAYLSRHRKGHQGSKELDLSREQQKGTSPQDSNNQYDPGASVLPACACHILWNLGSGL